MKFVNREDEIKYLHNHFKSEPNSLLFLYGPKSSGKSTLLSKVVNEIDTKKYVVNFLDLREMLIYNFDSFIDRFFPKTLYGKVQDLADGITFNIGFFGINLKSDEKLLQQNPFKLMGDKLRSAKEKNKQPIIIIDEIQLLKNIYINGERYLLDELFNLFIRLTKVTHTAHIILATSDSYFIEEIYNSAKLMQTSEFYFIDHFNREEVYRWLTAEGFTQNEIENVWKNIGGSPWEIQQILQKITNGLSVKQACEFYINEKYGKISYYRSEILDYKTINEFDRINKNIVEKGAYIRNDNEKPLIISPLIKDMVTHDFWSIDLSDD
ncbi:MAG: AAA family ATPase [Bacteroidia bacterium]|nr:AAA family ATPase [Bacteroidia bacterium]